MPKKFNTTTQGLATSGENIRGKRAIPALAIIQGIAAIDGMMIKGVNALVDAKRASSFNNAIKLVNKNVQITHDRLITLENRTAMMAIPALAIIQGIAAIDGMMIKGVNALVDAKRASSFNNAIKLVNENVQITHDRLITLENRTAMMAIPALAIIQGIAAIDGMMIKGVNALVDAKRASSFNNAIKLVNENVQITHDRLIILENSTAMMAKAIIPVLKDFKEKINIMNERLTRQYRMMIRAHDRYNKLFRQTHKTFQIHHLTLLMFKD